MTGADAMDVAPCPACGHAMWFEVDVTGRAHERCDQCVRNRQRARLGLPAIRLVDDRPIPPPTPAERAEFERKGSLDVDFANGELARRYAAGQSTVQLGKRYGVFPRAIGERLKRLGVPMRPKGCYLNVKHRRAA